MPDNRPLGILLVNLGTPDSTETPDVRRYLREFLNDPRVIDINPIGKWLLLNLIILPFRPAKSGEAYKTIWTERGSPLLFHGQDLAAGVARGAGRRLRGGVGDALRESVGQIRIRKTAQKDVRRIVVLPLFPQYSSAAFGSAVEKVMHEASKLWDVPPIDFMRDFYDHPEFIESVAQITEEKMKSFNSDYLLMSYHGIPERHVAKSDKDGSRLQPSRPMSQVHTGTATATGLSVMKHPMPCRASQSLTRPIHGCLPVTPW